MKCGIADKITLTVTVIAAVIIISVLRLAIRLGGFQ